MKIWFGHFLKRSNFEAFFKTEFFSTKSNSICAHKVLPIIRRIEGGWAEFGSWHVFFHEDRIQSSGFYSLHIQYIKQYLWFINNSKIWRKRYHIYAVNFTTKNVYTLAVDISQTFRMFAKYSSLSVDKLFCYQIRICFFLEGRLRICSTLPGSTIIHFTVRHSY